MGIKSLTLQMIPWCFHVAAGPAAPRRPSAAVYGGAAPADSPPPSPSPPPPPPPPSRVLFPDGRVRIYRHPAAAADVAASAAEHSGGGGGGGHLLCPSDAFVVGRRVPALAPGDRLAPGASYVLLPAHFFRANLSFLSLAASFPCPHKRSSIAPFVRPFDVEKTDSGEIRVRVSEEFLDGAARVRVSCGGEGESAEEVGINGGGGGRVCTTEELEKDYRQLVRSRSAAAAWRPKLETIRESKEKLRCGGSSGNGDGDGDGDGDGGRSGGGGAFGGIKRRKKKKKKQPHQQQRSLH